MSYSLDDVKRIHNLLGQALWHTQHLERIMTQYNAFMVLKTRQERAEFVREDDFKNALTTTKKRDLESLISEAKEQGFLPKYLCTQQKLFLKTKDWIMRECVNDIHLSFRKEDSKKHFFGIIESYIKDTKVIKTELFKEMESWLNTYDCELDI